MDNVRLNLVKAEKIAVALFHEVETGIRLIAGKDEETLNKEVFQLAKELFDIDKHWHKRIVRWEKNTLYPYKKTTK